jgi:Fe-S cluster assembly scaffold protein SufB
LENAGDVETVPLLKAKNNTVQLSHEASIGKISRQEIEYLQTKGLNEEEARELIVKGFVNDSVKKMPVSVQEKIAVMLASGKGF